VLLKAQEKGPCFQRFVDSLDKSPYTQKKYIQELGYYIRYSKAPNADALITNDLLDSPTKIRQVEDNIIEYIKYLHDVMKVSYSTIHVRLATVFHFYTINRVHIDRKYISKFKPTNKKIRKDNAYTHEQILTMLNGVGSLRERVIILLLCSTGMRGVLPNLSIGSLSKINLDGYPSHLYKIVVYEGEPDQYYTFCTFECANIIDQYLDYRKRFGEVLKPNSPLIREQFDHTDTFAAKRAQFLSLDGIRTIMDRMILVSGLRARTSRKEKYLHEVMLSHGMRKFAITQMKKAQLDFSDREYLVGHRHSRGLDVNYDRTTEEDRLKQYLKAIDLLTISPENQLRKQVQDRDYTITRKLQEKDMQIIRLTKQMAAMEQHQREVSDILKNLNQDKLQQLMNS
jgi:integrase